MPSKQTNLQTTDRRLLNGGPLVLLFAAALVLGAATAAWLSYGPQIFLTFANSALAWCF